MDSPAPHAPIVPADQLQQGTERLLSDVEALGDDAFAEPCALPGWTRGHLVAHSMLNAEGLAGVLEALRADESTTVYPSVEARDADIERWHDAAPAQLRERLTQACARLDRAIRAARPTDWATEVERTPGGRRFPAAAVTAMRQNEVEIHHVDLDVGYHPISWPQQFGAALIEVRGPMLAAELTAAEGFTIAAEDADLTWRIGPEVQPGQSAPESHVEDEVTVTGRLNDLAWWLTGRRPTQEGLLTVHSPAHPGGSAVIEHLPRIPTW